MTRAYEFVENRVRFWQTHRTWIRIRSTSRLFEFPISRVLLPWKEIQEYFLSAYPAVSSIPFYRFYIQYLNFISKSEYIYIQYLNFYIQIWIYLHPVSEFLYPNLNIFTSKYLNFCIQIWIYLHPNIWISISKSKYIYIQISRFFSNVFFCWAIKLSLTVMEVAKKIIWPDWFSRLLDTNILTDKQEKYI